MPGGRTQLNVRVAPDTPAALARLAADLGDLFGTPTSQGDALAWLLEVGAAEIERLRRLKATAPPAPPAACPWHLTARAIREYRVIAGVDREQAERELADIAIRCADPAREAEVKRQDNGLLLYRGPRPLRLRLLVAEIGELEMPSLVQVLPASPRGSRPEGAGSKERKRERARTAD